MNDLRNGRASTDDKLAMLERRTDMTADILLKMQDAQEKTISRIDTMSEKLDKLEEIIEADIASREAAPISYAEHKMINAKAHEMVYRYVTNRNDRVTISRYFNSIYGGARYHGLCKPIAITRHGAFEEIMLYMNNWSPSGIQESALQQHIDIITRK